MTTEDTNENLPESQTNWPGGILKTGLIFSCGVIVGAVIESMLDDLQTSNEESTPDDEEMDNDDQPEANASADDHENGAADLEADITPKSASTAFENFMSQLLPLVVKHIIQKDHKAV